MHLNPQKLIKKFVFTKSKPNSFIKRVKYSHKLNNLLKSNNFNVIDLLHFSNKFSYDGVHFTVEENRLIFIELIKSIRINEK